MVVVVVVVVCILQVRDVLPHTTGGKKLDDAVDEEKRRASDGVVPLQSGTNRLASQRGMTGFGTPRTVMLPCKWKKEWCVFAFRYGWAPIRNARASWAVRIYAPPYFLRYLSILFLFVPMLPFRRVSA